MNAVLIAYIFNCMRHYKQVCILSIQSNSRYGTKCYITTLSFIDINYVIDINHVIDKEHIERFVGQMCVVTIQMSDINIR